MATVAEGYDGPSIKGYWISDHCLKVVLNRAKVNAQVSGYLARGRFEADAACWTTKPGSTRPCGWSSVQSSRRSNSIRMSGRLCCVPA